MPSTRVSTPSEVSDLIANTNEQWGLGLTPEEQMRFVVKSKLESACGKNRGSDGKACVGLFQVNNKDVDGKPSTYTGIINNLKSGKYASLGINQEQANKMASYLQSHGALDDGANALATILLDKAELQQVGEANIAKVGREVAGYMTHFNGGGMAKRILEGYPANKDAPLTQIIPQDKYSTYFNATNARLLGTVDHPKTVGEYVQAVQNNIENAKSQIGLVAGFVDTNTDLNPADSMPHVLKNLESHSPEKVAEIRKLLEDEKTKGKGLHELRALNLEALKELHLVNPQTGTPDFNAQHFAAKFGAYDAAKIIEAAKDPAKKDKPLSELGIPTEAIAAYHKETGTELKAAAEKDGELAKLLAKKPEELTPADMEQLSKARSLTYNAKIEAERARIRTNSTSPGSEEDGIADSWLKDLLVNPDGSMNFGMMLVACFLMMMFGDKIGGLLGDIFGKQNVPGAQDQFTPPATEPPAPATSSPMPPPAPNPEQPAPPQQGSTAPASMPSDKPAPGADQSSGSKDSAPQGQIQPPPSNPESPREPVVPGEKHSEISAPDGRELFASMLTSAGFQKPQQPLPAKHMAANGSSLVALNASAAAEVIRQV